MSKRIPQINYRPSTRSSSILRYHTTSLHNTRASLSQHFTDFIGRRVRVSSTIMISSVRSKRSRGTQFSPVTLERTKTALLRSFLEAPNNGTLVEAYHTSKMHFITPSAISIASLVAWPGAATLWGASSLPTMGGLTPYLPISPPSSVAATERCPRNQETIPLSEMAQLATPILLRSVSIQPSGTVSFFMYLS